MKVDEGQQVAWILGDFSGNLKLKWDKMALRLDKKVSRLVGRDFDLVVTEWFFDEKK